MFRKNKNKKQNFIDRILFGSKNVVEEKPIVIPVQEKKENIEETVAPETVLKSPIIIVEPEKKVEALVPPVIKINIPVLQKQEEIIVAPEQKETPVLHKPNIEVKEVKVKLILQRDVDASKSEQREIKVSSKEHFFVNEEEPANFLPPLVSKVKFITRDKYFSLGNGKHLGSIAELRDALGTLPEQSWRQFVTEDSNSFANWIDGAFNEYDLGTKLRSTHDKQKAIAILSSFLFRS
jgi:hypothetical protein